MTRIHALSTSLLALSFVGTSAFSEEMNTEKSGWEHSVEIYALALNIRGDSTIGNLSADVDVDPKFIMDHIDMGAMLRLEGIYDNQWGYYIDYSYMNLSASTNSVLNTSLELLKGKTEIRQGVLEAKGFKRYQYDFGSIDYMFGIRWWDNDIDAKLYTTNGNLSSSKSLNEDWVDYLIGARWINDITDKWQFHASIDAGLSGDTSFTSSVLTGVRYEMNEWSDLNMAYKSTWVDYDNEGTFTYNTASQGFLVGVGLYF
ncbi:hypothetical protein [Aliivibrio sp. 1S128]|uniref:hypothetical protein n=1 Tax=Aliivibrio sp. 1S128 TaxID=1840085 RepID=UPI00080E63D4|nr:hypothetical protein [Aliivibrio sp. 1S128]OCH15622.1 hypothetical protein A6E03_02910 [Aliivibrio sp. 1S128]